jgi:hypothetical protein
MPAAWDQAKLPSWKRVIDRIETALLAEPQLEQLLLRLERSGRTDPPVEAEMRGHAAALAVELMHHQRKDGSWKDDVFATCDALRTLRDLRAEGEAVDAAAAAAAAWLRGRVGAAGRFGEGCDSTRHEAGLCHHVLPPFCGIGHAGTDLRGARLADGTVFASDTEARLCGAAQALRELIVADGDRTSVKLQAAALDRLAARGDSGTVPSLGAAAFAAIGDALRMRKHAPPAAALRAVAARQRGDGTWPSGDMLILDALGRACVAGVAEAREPLRRAADHIVLSYSERALHSESPRRLLVVWRVLRCVM